MMPEAHDAQLIRRIAAQDQLGLRRLYARETRVFRFPLRLVRQEAIAEGLDPDGDIVWSRIMEATNG